MFGHPVVAALNHLLVGSGWALPRLAKFAGKTVRFEIAPFSVSCTILDDGTLLSAPADTTADATCSIAPSLLPRLALRDELALEQIEAHGDAALIAEIIFLVRNLRWDVTEDLSRVTGDIAAERIVQLVRAGEQQARDTALNLSQALAEYWTEEKPLLAKPQMVAAFVADVNALRDEVEKLEQRIKGLDRQ